MPRCSTGDMNRDLAEAKVDPGRGAGHEWSSDGIFWAPALPCVMARPSWERGAAGKMEARASSAARHGQQREGERGGRHGRERSQAPSLLPWTKEEEREWRLNFFEGWECKMTKCKGRGPYLYRNPRIRVPKWAKWVELGWPKTLKRAALIYFSE